jgi:hypothetical protein
MSDNWLAFVPCDPNFQASQEAIAAALSLLRQFAPTTEEITVEGDGSVAFFHAGSNLESISCPSCGADLQDWWGDAMNEAWKSHFENLSIVTPCCRNATSLNNLSYDWPMAFGRFALELFNPRTKIGDEQRKQLEQTLGTPLKTVWCHL